MRVGLCVIGIKPKHTRIQNPSLTSSPEGEQIQGKQMVLGRSDRSEKWNKFCSLTLKTRKQIKHGFAKSFAATPGECFRISRLSLLFLFICSWTIFGIRSSQHHNRKCEREKNERRAKLVTSDKFRLNKCDMGWFHSSIKQTHKNPVLSFYLVALFNTFWKEPKGK